MQKYYYLILVLFASCTSVSQLPNFSYPRTISNPISEKVNDISLTDPYRHLENIRDTIIHKWFISQTSFTDSILSTYNDIDSIEIKLKEVNGRTLSWAKSLKQDDLGNVYYLKYREQDKFYMLFLKQKSTDEEIILFDPQTYKPKSGLEYYIDYIKPSWDGKYVAISLRHSNTFDSEIVVLNTQTKSLTDDFVSNCRARSYGGLNWLPDSSGFTYLYVPIVKKNQDGYLKNSNTLLHMLHSGVTKGSFVFGTQDEIIIDASVFPILNISSSSDKYAIGYVMDNSHYFVTYYASIKSIKMGMPIWKNLYDSEDLIFSNQGKFKGDKFFYKSAKNAPNYQVNYVHLDTLNFEKPTVFIKQQEDEVFSDFVFTEYGVYYTGTKNGVQVNLYFKNDSSTRQVKLPFNAGNIKIIDPLGKGNQIIIEISGWANDLARFRVVSDKVVERVNFATVPIMPEFNNFISEESFVTGHDNVQIPISIIYDKKLGKLNKPVFIESYGSYGHSYKPRFNPSLLTWISLGGIRVIAHIRGGGEKGKSWHDAGKKETKSNSWYDIISVTQHLIEKGYTTKDKTVLFSESAGAIAQAMAIIKLPNLFNTFISRVPLLNPTRLKEGSHAQLSYTEFGDIDIPEEVPHLINLDPYYNLNESINFPATLFYAAGKDDRLDLWETGKFIAKLQNSKSSRGPYLLKVMPDWGHGSSSNRSYAELFAFALNNIKSSGAEH